MTTEAAGQGPVDRIVGPGAEAPTFEAWFLDRYSYTRAVLTNPIWAREIADAAEAFAAGQAAERAKCAAAVKDVPSHHWVDGSDQWGQP